MRKVSYNLETLSSCGERRNTEVSHLSAPYGIFLFITCVDNGVKYHSEQKATNTTPAISSLHFRVQVIS